MTAQLRRIGQGFCGTVWASSSESSAFKREDGGPGRSLYNDYTMHLKALESLHTHHEHRVCVPACHGYVPSDDRTWWDSNLSAFPKGSQISCNVLITERIPPFLDGARSAIIERYCPEELTASIKSSKPDEDCLIRPYLGRRRLVPRRKQSQFRAFSLRNYPLHVDQIEELQLDGALYARVMAKTLASLYWIAHMDANDVEFVLAPPRHNQTDTESAGAHTMQSSILGDHCVWLLDFDCCRAMSQDEAGVQQAVAAFYRNDPFYPRPGRTDDRDQRLWEEFKDQFLTSSAAILDPESPEARLPGYWIALVEQRS
ncbi:MAG: hypothetical protein LQ345_004975 [Seirophora villosa]|nr:MAG: hypothetical protein LQ345_004975 [Seirophora villosa]